MAIAPSQRRVAIRRKPKPTDKVASTPAKPDTQGSYALGMAVRWSLADALMGGSEAMRRMGKDLLPKHDNETDDVYSARLKRSFLLPVFAQTVESLADIVFSKPVGRADSVPADLATILEDVDAEGNSIDAFAKLVFAQAMAKGECYVIADEPPVIPAEPGKVITLDDRRKQNVRPYLAIISADNMLAFETVTRGGQTSVVYARWKETETRQGDDFLETIVQRVVEWKPGQWRKFEKIGSGSWGEPTTGDLNFKLNGKPHLPIHRFRIGTVDSAGLLLPPLHGLAEKNVEHWQSSSDQRAILTISRFPMLGGSGVDREELETDESAKSSGGIKIGPQVTLFARDPQSKFYYVEPTGTAIEAGEKDLTRLETDMSQLAYQPLMRQQAGVTATKDALGQNKANSSLEAWGQSLNDVLDKVVSFLSLWQGVAPFATAFKVNDEFGIDTIDTTRVTALQAMRSAGDLSRPQFLKQMSREGVLDEEFDAEANDTELENEGPTMAEMEAMGGLNLDADEDEEDEDDDEATREPKAA